MSKLGRPGQPCWLWLPSASANSCLHIYILGLTSSTYQHLCRVRSRFLLNSVFFLEGEGRLHSIWMPVSTSHHARMFHCLCIPSQICVVSCCCGVLMTMQDTPDMLKRQALVSEVQAQIPRRTQYYTIPLHQAVPAADWALHSV